MKLRLYIQTFLAVAFLILAVSCGGGGGGSNGGGIGGTGFNDTSSGSVEGFGSIILNGRELETENPEVETQVEIEGEDPFPCSPSLTEDCGLHEGMVVTVEGAFDDNGTTGTAAKIKYEDNLKGPITSVTPSAQGLSKTLSVMEQEIIVEDGVTQFDDSDPGFTFASLGAGNAGNVVEVSGFDDGTRIRATYIQKKEDDLATFLGAGNELEIKGTVSAANFNPPTSFEINGLTIDFAGVPVRNGTLAVGALVEVKGNALAGSTLTATDVEIKPAGLGVDDAQKAEVEGYITSFNPGALTFAVNGQPVSYASASFEGGTAADLANGVKVEAEGPISGGTLQAVKIEFEDSVKFEANADNVNAGAGTLTLQNLPGITVQADDLTEFIGVANLSGIATNNEVKIRGRRATPTGTTVIATEIELIDTNPADRTIIQGPVDSFVPLTSVTILGVLVDTTTIQDNDFKDHDTPIGEAAFYGNLADGDLVKARFRSGAWDQIEFED
jgi:hypothetical protein